jgi:hypothetical protein
MLFPHLTRQQITIDGTWQRTGSHHRLTGTVSSSAPFVILSLLNCGETYHYRKHTKGNDLDVSLVWYQMKCPLVDRDQHTVSIAHAVNLGAYPEGRVCLAVSLPMTFSSGALVTFARDRQSQPFLSPGDCEGEHRLEAQWARGAQTTAAGKSASIMAGNLLQDTPWVQAHRIGVKRNEAVLHRSDRRTHRRLRSYWK